MIMMTGSDNGVHRVLRCSTYSCALIAIADGSCLAPLGLPLELPPTINYPTCPIRPQACALTTQRMGGAFICTRKEKQY